MQNNDKLKWITKYLESNTSLYTFAKTNGLNYGSLKKWIAQYEANKDAWQVAEINDGEIVESEIKPVSKEIAPTKHEAINSNIVIKFKDYEITCDDKSFSKVWRVIYA